MTEIRDAAPAVSVAPDEPHGPRVSRLSRLASSSTLYLLAGLLGLTVVFGVRAPDAFLSGYNVRELMIQSSLLLVVAVGATFVVATAGIDLSIGGVLVFSGVVSLKLILRLGGHGWAAIAAGLICALAAGAAFGILNGLLVTKARVPALIATLGTLGVSLGLAQVMTNGTDLSGVPVALTDSLGQGRLFGVVPWLVVIAAVVLAGGLTALHLTRFGLYTLAIGSNREAVRRSGIAVDKHLVKVYAWAGLLSGLAGFLSLARFASTTIAGHGSDNLQAISAVVLGGTSLFGGVATLVGTVIGVFIPTVMQNGFVILGIPPYWQQVAIGVVLVLAVCIDQFRRTARQKS